MALESLAYSGSTANVYQVILFLTENWDCLIQ